MDGVRATRPQRRPAVGCVRRGVAAHVPPSLVAPHGCSLAAGARLRHREHADLPPALRPRQRRRTKASPFAHSPPPCSPTPRPASSTARSPTSSAPPPLPSGSLVPSGRCCQRSAPARGCSRSSTGPSSYSISSTPPSWSSLTDSRMSAVWIVLPVPKPPATPVVKRIRIVERLRHVTLAALGAPVTLLRCAFRDCAEPSRGRPPGAPRRQLRS